MRLTEITIFALVILLTFSVGVNVFMYTGRNPDAVKEIVMVSDTVVRIDTVIRVVTNRIILEKPVPVYVDTTANIRTYRDTIRHEFGLIHREEIVLGELLKKDLQFDFKIPEVYKTITVNTVSTHYVRRRLFFATVGVQSDFNGVTSPSIGGQYILKDHLMSLSYHYSPMYNQHSVVFGLGLVR